METNCLFCGIVQGDISANILYHDEEIIAFHDINPQAPIHLLVIPKKHIANINEATVEDTQLLGRMILVAQKLANEHAIASQGYRLIYNVNSHGGQTVYHIHLHVLGGRSMTWPPG